MTTTAILPALLLAASASAFVPVSSTTRIQSSISAKHSSSQDGDHLLLPPPQQLQTTTTPTRRSIISSLLAGSLALSTMPQLSSARLDPVNRPDLLPSEKGLNVIQVEKFLTTGQAKRLDTLLSSLEKDTGFRVRVLCQRYPNTPGLAIRDYWDLGKEVCLFVPRRGGGMVLSF